MRFKLVRCQRGDYHFWARAKGHTSGGHRGGSERPYEYPPIKVGQHQGLQPQHCQHCWERGPGSGCERQRDEQRLLWSQLHR